MSDFAKISGSAAPGGAVFDIQAASEAMGLTVDEFAPLLPKAAKELRFRLDEVRRGVADNDLHAIALNSHTVKSVAATLGAEDARAAALDLELCAKGGDGARCAGLLAGLERRIAELLGELDRA